MFGGWPFGAPQFGDGTPGIANPPAADTSILSGDASVSGITEGDMTDTIAPAPASMVGIAAGDAVVI